MSQYAGFGLILIVTLAIGGCSNTEPDATQSTATVADQTPPAGKAEPVAADEPSGAEAPDADTQPAETKPTVLGAIGQAVAGALGASDDDQPGEAPAYKPRQ